MWEYKILLLVLIVATAYCAMDKEMTDAVNEATEMVEASMSVMQGLRKHCSKNPTSACLHRYRRQASSPKWTKAEIFEKACAILKKKGKHCKKMTGKEQEDLAHQAECEEALTNEDVGSCRGFRRKRGFRTIDGTCNNLRKNNRALGAAFTPYRREEPAEYEDGFSEPKGFNVPAPPGLYFGHDLPSPRLVSTRVVRAVNIPLDPRLSHMVFQFGQFMDHDCTFTPTVAPAAECEHVCSNNLPCFPIIPPYVPNERFNQGECISNIRSAAVCKVNSKKRYQREQFTELTHWIDASNVYGSEVERAEQLRELENKTLIGNLKVQTFDGVHGDFLPAEEGESEMECLQNPNSSVRVECFAAGDIRSNEQIGLAAMHTLWMREHNRIAAKLRDLNPHWDGERVYQEARKIVGAMLQIITYEDWLPRILGAPLPPYPGYDNKIDARLENIFGVAVFRLGHGLIKPVTPRLNEYLTPIADGNIELHKTFFSPWLVVEQGGIEPLLRGMYGTEAKLMSPTEQVTDEVTEQLFTLSEDPALDLAALNIQRARDHGLPFYNTFRVRCGLQTLQPHPNKPGTFHPLKNEMDPTVIHRLKEVYPIPTIIDPWVGMLSERLLPGARVGPTFKCLLEDQFTRLRNGDRFWWENRGVFTKRQRHTLRKNVSLSRVLCDNGYGIDKIQKDAFLCLSDSVKRVPCSKLPSVNLHLWKDKKGNKGKPRSSSSSEDDNGGGGCGYGKG